MRGGPAAAHKPCAGDVDHDQGILLLAAGVAFGSRHHVLRLARREQPCGRVAGVVAGQRLAFRHPGLHGLVLQRLHVEHGVVAQEQPAPAGELGAGFGVDVLDAVITHRTRLAVLAVQPLQARQVGALVAEAAHDEPPCSSVTRWKSVVITSSAGRGALMSRSTRQKRVPTWGTSTSWPRQRTLKEVTSRVAKGLPLVLGKPPLEIRRPVATISNGP
jgi:hypothetical protein